MGGPVWPLKAIINDRANRAVALKEVVEHRKDFAAVADLAHRQRRSIGAQTLIQRPKRRIGHIEPAATGFADFQVGKELANRQYHLGQQPARGHSVRKGIISRRPGRRCSSQRGKTAT
jgi:hypothetical protein